MGDSTSGLRPPCDQRLPFFAYGLFQPSELAYRQIEKYVGALGACGVSWGPAATRRAAFARPSERRGSCARSAIAASSRDEWGCVQRNIDIRAQASLLLGHPESSRP